jgi:hypothetical protein
MRITGGSQAVLPYRAIPSALSNSPGLGSHGSSRSAATCASRPWTGVTPSNGTGRHGAARHGRRRADPAGRRHSRADSDSSASRRLNAPDVKNRTAIRARGRWRQLTSAVTVAVFGPEDLVTFTASQLMLDLSALPFHPAGVAARCHWPGGRRPGAVPGGLAGRSLGVRVGWRSHHNLVRASARLSTPTAA